MVHKQGDEMGKRSFFYLFYVLMEKGTAACVLGIFGERPEVKGRAHGCIWVIVGSSPTKSSPLESGGKFFTHNSGESEYMILTYKDQ